MIFFGTTGESIHLCSPLLGYAGGADGAESAHRVHGRGQDAHTANAAGLLHLGPLAVLAVLAFLGERWEVPLVLRVARVVDVHAARLGA